jgi:glycosyltransferase involved in cell wall biosynthesis/SAM-dependent methyltransferase
MGVIAERPSGTADFYTDDYYHRNEDSTHGYVDYEFTAEHGLLWVHLLTELLHPAGGAVLDIGCATGFLLRRLGGTWRRYGIEANPAAATTAAAAGIAMIGDDVLAPELLVSHRGAFDVITAIATFEHVLDIRAAVAASLAMLAPSGTLIFEVPLISTRRDNSDWFNGSYEHIFYPTVRAIEALFATFPDVHFQGFETDIAGFSSSYIGIATRDPAGFAAAQRLLDVMIADDPQALSDDDARLNLAYTVVHNFRPTPARISRLPVLLERCFTPPLGTRLMQLWHVDALRAANADWYEMQARRWRAVAEGQVIQSQPQEAAREAEPSCAPATQTRTKSTQYLLRDSQKSLPTAASRAQRSALVGVVALLPFLVEGALSLAVLRALHAEGADVAVAFCAADSGGYTPDPMADFAAEGRLIDLSALHPGYRQDRLQREFAARGTRLVLQIGAYSLYPSLPYLKERDPALRLVDILYNEIGHTLNHFLYEACFDGVIVESQQMLRFVRNSTLKSDPHVRVVESGIDLEAFVPRSGDPTPGQLRIGYLGRLSPEKNPLGFIALAERVAERVPGLLATVAGDGPMASEVRQRIAQSPMVDRLAYLGRVESAADVLRTFDVLIVPSILDGRPNVIMEANACGVPVIGAPVGGIPELIEDGVNGYLAAPAETDRIGNWLRAYANDPAALTAMRAACRGTAKARFDRHRMIADYADAFAHFIGS